MMKSRQGMLQLLQWLLLRLLMSLLNQPLR
jgi:hypothetical protein